MNTILKRVISLVLCFVLVAGFLPTGVLAAETGETVTTEATKVTTEPTQEASPEATEPEVIPVTGITLDRTALEVGVGAEPVTLVATVTPEDATDKNVTWASSEPGVASVVDGVVTFGYMGEAVITATAGGFSASCTVKVSESNAVAYDLEGVVDAAIFFSDLHTNRSDYKENTVKGAMNALKNTGLPFSSVTSCGDAFSVNEDSGKYTGDPSKITGYIQSVFVGIPVYYVWSDHDRYAGLDNDSGFVYGAGADGTYGTSDDGNYYIYELSMADLSTNNRYNADFHSNSEVTATIAAFVADAEKLDQTKPLFIAGHQPLLDRRNDNGHALEWATAINTVAENMDVAYFFGHNHKYDVAGDYYYAKGSTMSVCKDSYGNAQDVKLNFTHLCAGYLAPSSTGSTSTTTRQGTLLAVTILEDAVQYVTYNANGEYTGSYAVNETVERDHAAPAVSLTSIAVTTAPTTVEYTVGDTFTSEGLVVTATYSDGSTEAVTGYTLSEVDMTTAGEKEVTVTYEGMTASFKITVKSAEPTVNTVECWDDTELVTVKATGLGLTAVEATNVTGENEKCDEIFTEYGYMAFDIALTGLVEGESVKYSISVVPDLDITNLELYYVDENGELIPVEFQLTTDELGNVYVEFTTDKVGTFVYGSPAVPEGYTLTSLALANIPRDIFRGGSLDLLNAEITATYIKAGAEDFVRKLTAYDYDDTNFSGFDVNLAGKQTVIFTFEGVTATYEIHVWGDSVTAEGVTVALDVTGAGYGVTAVNVAESTNAHVADAVANVMSNYVAYDISLVYESGYAATEDTKTVTLPVPEGVTNPVVYYVSDNGYNVIDMNATVSEDGKTVSFETKHFSTYVVGENTEITVPKEETANGSVTTTTTEEKEVYVLVSTPTAGKQYIIVNRNTAGSGYALKENTTTGTSVTIKAAGNGIAAPYIETTDETIMWNTASGMTFQSENGGYYLRYNNGLTFSTRSSTNWTVGANTAYVYSRSRYRYVYNNSGTWTTSSSQNTSSSYSVYFYEKQTVEVETTTTVSGTYSIAGTDETVAAITDATVDLTSILSFTTSNGVTNPEMDATKLSYSIVTEDKDGNPVNGDPLGVISGISGNTVTLSGKVGKALLKVSYATDFGPVTDYITVTATTPDHYSIQLHEVELTVAAGVTADNFASNTYYTYDSKTGFYRVATAYAEGTTYYTLPVIQGDAITAPIALKGVEKGDSYSVWAVVKAYATADDAEGVNIGTLGDALSWTVSDESIATINKDTGVITFTGTNYGTFDVTVAFTGADGKTITDTITISATKTLYTVPGDGTDDFPEYPNEGAVRFDKTATAVGNYSETGIAKVELSMTGVPYTSGNRLDVVLMLDRSSSMYKSGVQHRISSTVEATKAFIKNIVMNEDGSFNNNRILVLDFLGGNLDSSAGGGSSHKFQSNQYTANEENGYQIISSQAELDALLTKIETDFKGQTSLYGTEYAQGLELCYNALQNSKSDGNQQFCVFMSDGIPNYMMGETTHFKKTNDIVATFDVTNRTAANGTATRNATKYEYEKYSTMMKNNGVTVFTVGLGLKNTNSAWSGTSKEVCEQVANMLLNDISGPAGETAAQRDTGNEVSKLNKYFFSVADDNAAADMKDVFSAISQKIVEAAKDVVVEDKIGNNYTLNFSVPGYGTDNAVSEDALDGLTEFYIQAVEYQLNANKERTGEPTVLENFTFNADGSFKSHTVNGTACANCSHVTVTNGTITKIEGTYFNYEVKADGEYLHWEADKLTTTELALQYFAYLDNSAGVEAKDQIPAGTYYTNEYATLTYTNYNGNQVQQEFPKPQMTWNGAQVSYVFYLVNEAGQPVNRAGRVVPFAEAVYVTDVYTYSVIWNDLEQAAGLEAKYLAQEKVPDVYALYDDDASYQIHVYEKENEVNLNNHFVIGGNVGDDTNNWTNPKTTYVFNNKSDATKYNTVGAYIANDGKDNTTSNAYYCKSAAIEGATYTTSVDEAGVTVHTVTGLGSGYQSVSGETQVQANVLPSTTGATIISGYAYYVDESGAVYTIVQKTNGTEVEKGFDFHNTTVAFAVVWKPELVEDTVVVDYGLDVVIDVIKNDNMAAGVVGVRTDAPSNVTQNSGNYTAEKETSADVYIDTNNDADGLKELKIGTATVENLNSVRFSLDETNGMQFTDPAVFYYEADVNYYDSNNELQTTSMYSKVTVIPATTVYYEDDFLTLASFSKSGDTWAQDDNSKWTASVQNGVQDQDRPGESKISEALDADNVYGYDSAYETMSTHSLNNSAHITVDAGTRGEATFTFYGTGFDVISTTSNTTGTLTVQVYSGTEATGAAMKTSIVDTYYGMDADGNISLNTPDAIYQVPVMKISGLTYGQYTVKITAGYNAIFDHDNGGSYELYLDAIRIYDPTGNQDDTANDAYLDDGEAWPTYQELRNNIIAASKYTVTENEDGTVTVTGTDLSGAIFIDCNDATTSIADYVSYGPNNELYLANDQAIAFTVTDADIADIQLGIKVANGNSVTYEINGDSYTVNTTTDMYYSILDYAKDSGVVTIKNVSGGILSLTNIKVTHTTAPADPSGISLLSMDGESAGIALMMLRRAPVVEDEVPETTVPEVTEPEETEPEETVPEETKPNKDAEKLQKELKKAMEKAAKEAEKLAKELQKAAEKAAKALSKLFGKWF